MSVNNFKPTIWSANILATLQKTLVFASPMITNRNYEGAISGFGDRVKINQIGDVTVSNYDKDVNISYQSMSDAAQFLDIDKQKYFAINLDDVDAAQVNVDLMSAYASQAAYAISDVVDQTLSGLYGSAGVTANLGTTGTPLTITAADTSGGNVGILELLRRMMVALNKNNVPKAGRFVVLSPDLAGRLAERNVTLYNVRQTQEAADNGFIGNFYGFNIFESNNVADVGTAAVPKQKILAGTNIAITMAQQIAKIESVRRENSFADAVRGLYVYGAKVVRPEALACATVTPA